MSDSKHTPGPWEVNDGMVTRFPAVKGQGNIICLSPETDRSIAMWPANASLISAAPDLLGVLTELMEVLRKEAPGTPLNNHRFDSLGIRAYEAIAKAGG